MKSEENRSNPSGLHVAGGDGGRVGDGGQRIDDKFLLKQIHTNGVMLGVLKKEN